MKLHDQIQETLASILQHLGVTFKKFKIEELETVFNGSKHPVYRIDIDTDDASLLIGYHGETIYALQQILKTILWNKTDQNIFVMVDVDGYRKRQEDSVKKIAKQKADLARKTGQGQLLPPMSSYFRRIVHLYFGESEFSDLTTESIGEGDHRQIMISLKGS